MIDNLTAYTGTMGPTLNIPIGFFGNWPAPVVLPDRFDVKMQAKWFWEGLLDLVKPHRQAFVSVCQICQFVNFVARITIRSALLPLREWKMKLWKQHHGELKNV